MKRKVTLMLLLFCICRLSACSDDVTLPEVLLPDDDVDSVVPELNFELPSFYTPSEVMENLSISLSYEKNYIKKQTGISSGYATVFGTNTAAEQSISNTTYKYNGSFFLDTQSVTTKSFLNITSNIYHKAYFDGLDVAYNHSSRTIADSDTPDVLTEESYKDEYGILANSNNFTGYIINDDTIDNVDVDEKEDIYTYSFDLNTTTSCEDMYVQMVEFGGITNLKLISINVTVSIDSNWNIIALDTTEVYTAKKSGFNIAMTQKLSTVFSYFDIENLGSVELPNLSAYLTALEEE